jgi:hypothetical protein
MIICSYLQYNIDRFQIKINASSKKKKAVAFFDLCLIISYRGTIDILEKYLNVKKQDLNLCRVIK